MEDELYGNDIYDDAPLDFEPDDPYDDQDQDNSYIPKPTDEGEQLGNGGTGTTDATDQYEDRPELISRISEQDQHIADLEAQLKETQASTDKWRAAFREIASSCGLPFSATRDPDVQSVIETFHVAKNAEKNLQEELRSLRKREAALQVALADKAMEGVELRRELHSAQQASDPSIIQLKQLLLDPAVSREFNRLRKDLEAAHKELASVKEELQAVTFSQESKTGKALMAKCRTLVEENEEMGRELAEGRQHQLEAQLAQAKEFAEEVRKNYFELEDHCDLLNEESEQLQTLVFALHKELSDREANPGGMGNPMHGGQSFMRRKMEGGPMMGAQGPGMFGERKMMGGGRGGMERKRMMGGDKEGGMPGDGPPGRPMMMGGGGRFMNRKRMR